ncbi:hypothetical protein BJ742DRAFT_878843 [Cladochytrium replicatum]|nr:hypothetical protein BJ742DRAFT_878843 [Cladochytrium replicatum]
MTRTVRKILGQRPDAFPNIPAAGIPVNPDPTGAKDCLVFDSKQEPWKKPSLIDYSARFGSTDNAMTHGIGPSVDGEAIDVIFPNRVHPLLTERERLRERNYHRREHQVLGHSVPTGAKLPPFTMHEDFRFGVCTIEDDDVKTIMYPGVGDDMDELVKRQYIFSHGSYAPGEQRDYNYDWSKYPRESTWGVEIDHDNNGGRMKTYLGEEPLSKHKELHGQLSSKRLWEFREKRQKEIGKVFDPIRDTMAHLPNDYTFGRTFPPDEYNVGDLLGCASTSKAYREKYRRHHKTTVVDKDTLSGETVDPKDRVTNNPASLHPPPLKIPCLPPHQLQQFQGVTPKITNTTMEELTQRKWVSIPPESAECSTAYPSSIKMNLKGYIPRDFGDDHVFGVPTIRIKKFGRAKRFSDDTNYGDQPSAKAAVFPTPRNVYGEAKLSEFAALLEGTSLGEQQGASPSLPKAAISAA